MCLCLSKYPSLFSQSETTGKVNFTHALCIPLFKPQAPNLFVPKKAAKRPKHHLPCLLHLSSIRLPQRTQPTPTQQNPITGHKVRIPLHRRIPIQIRRRLRNEVRHIAVTSTGAELSKPDFRHALRLREGNDIVDVRFEVREVAGAVIPVEGDEVDLALAAAGVEEGAEPVQAHEGALAGAVGDCGRADFARVREGVEVLDVVLGGGRGVHVRLGAEVGLVE